MYLICVIIFCCNIKLISSFSPTTSDYDAYGIKIAANDGFFVQANGGSATFLVQFAPYNFTGNSLECTLNYDDSTHYVYSVGVGQQQNTSLHPYFYFAGEVASSGASNTDSLGRNGTFIGIWRNQDSQTIQQYLSSRQPISCNYFAVNQLQFLSSYKHQEFFVIAVEPYGQYAIGLATDFGFLYQPFSSPTMTTKASTSIWPNNSTFYPCAADASTTFVIVAGFAAGAAMSRVRATPTVYLLDNATLTVLSTWSYSATNNSWQSRLAYSGAATWNNQYTMTVKINTNDPTRVLIGMPFLNTVFLFTVSSNGKSFTLSSSFSNGTTVGYGKSVTWLTTSQAAILVSTYSLNYAVWYSTQVYLYTELNGTSIPSSPSAVIPNAQQPLPSTINANLIRITSTPESLVILDQNGGVIIFVPEPAGYYASTDTSHSPIAASMPVVSFSQHCIGGTYKPTTGVHPCTLCPAGSKNPSGMPAQTCITCSSDSFCPLGAVYEINASSLVSVSQAYPYPRSPDLDVFEDILLYNMFSMNLTNHCLVVSPMFWSLIALGILIVFLSIMNSLNFFVRKQTQDRVFTLVKVVFRKTDLLGEGELWIGGLASIIIILVSAMAYAFALSFLNQYPSEQVGPSTFACDETLRNSKYETNLQPLAVPVLDEEQVIFDLLDEQNFTLNLEFINTVISCMSLTIFEVTDSSTASLPFLSCSNWNGTLSVSVLLPNHDIVIKAILSEINLIGGVRVGIQGPNSTKGLCSLKELNFFQSFYSQSIGTFAQTSSITLAMTKSINETEPLHGNDSEFAGIWYPTFTYSLNAMFITADAYTMSANLTSTTFIIDIRETSYYIKHTQAPITKQAEVIFRTLLFSFLCLEISGLAFLICKLLLIPIYNRIGNRVCPGIMSLNAIEPELEMKHTNH